MYNMIKKKVNLDPEAEKKHLENCLLVNSLHGLYVSHFTDTPKCPFSQLY